MAKITGTENADVLAGKLGEGNDISGLGGADTLTGGDLSDSIDGGQGDDVILSGGGIGNVLFGGVGADRLIGGSDYPEMKTFDLLDGGDGADHLVGGISDTLIGGIGADTIEAEYRADVRAGDGDDVIDVGLLDSTIDGGAGVDTLVASEQLSDAASIKNVEILAVDGGLYATVEELAQFTAIRSDKPGSIFSLGVSGSVDLSGKLGSSSVYVGTTATNAKIVTGEGDDHLSGSYDGEYWLDGRGGNDTLDGYDGPATLIGGAGDDEFTSTSDTFLIDGGTGDDVVRLSSVVKTGAITGGAGYDRLIVNGDITKAQISGVEELSSDSPLTATAAQFEAFEKVSGADIYGVANLLLAEAGAMDLADELGDGKASITGSTGSDAITSGAGDDTIVGGEGDDTIHGGAGSDQLSVEYGSDQIFGDAGDDVITLHRYDANAIDGGAGQDTLAANDSFQDVSVDLSRSTVTGVETLVANARVVTATAAQFDGFDSITNSFSSKFDLRIVGGGEADLSDELDDKSAKIAGSSANDTIRSGAGDDTLEGGSGDDRLEGSIGRDSLSGGAGADTLYGGVGGDRLNGGQGGDLYIIDDTSDRIEDTGFKGIDQVASSLSHRLAKSVEDLKLTGAADIDGTGNGGANSLAGNGGDNRLDGGAGVDALRGKAGDDVFVFANRLSKSNVDEILDLGKGEDRIELDRDIFGGLSKGALADSAFKDISDGDVDKNDRILYDSKSGQLFYDADGSGKSKAVLFAELNGTPTISSDDFLIV